MARILVIDGHPDPDPGHYVHALAAAYRQGAEEAGHEVECITVAELQFPLPRSRTDWEGAPPPDIARAQEAVRRAEHLVFFYPLWLGDLPALFKGFMEQLARPGFALSYEAGFPKGLLQGRSARVVVTCGMPGIIYRLFYGAHSLKSFERSVLRLAGIGPVRGTVIGMVDGNPAQRTKWLHRMRDWGRAAR